MKKVVIIGSGFAGLSAACFMARDGWEVTVLEKQAGPGGRAGQLKAEGFVFDMGPSWYWMPDVFERFFSFFGKKVSDYYRLERLDPSYSIYWRNEKMDIPAGPEEVRKLFEYIEPGSGTKLDKFFNEAAYKYEVGINKLAHKPGLSLTEFLDWDLVKGLFRLDLFSSMKKHISKYFSDPRLQQIMEFPVLFLGALAEDIPALYSLMNYADTHLGTWYPKGGMYRIVEAMYALARELKVNFFFNDAVTSIEVEKGMAKKVTTESGKIYPAVALIGAADYHFIENELLPPNCRSYSEKYWNSRVMAPGCLLYYVGVNKKLRSLSHHSLFFDVDFTEHGKAIFKTHSWPADPLFYVCAGSVTDDTVAPPGCENLFFLIPVAAGLTGDTDELRNSYFDRILERFEWQTGESVRPHIIYNRSYSLSDFVNDYNSFKGNAYGLANTLMQTAILKPKMRSKKVKNLFYTGQLTVPGPGVPPSLISGEVVSKLVNRNFG